MQLDEEPFSQTVYKNGYLVYLETITFIKKSRNSHMHCYYEKKHRIFNFKMNKSDFKLKKGEEFFISIELKYRTLKKKNKGKPNIVKLIA